MKVKNLLSAFGVVLFTAFSLAAQQQPGTIAALEFQKPKNGMVPQYETGRKQKAEWHKQQKDPLPLFVWETLSGDNTGTYIVGRLGQHWADFDKPPIPEQAPAADLDAGLARFREHLQALSDCSGRAEQTVAAADADLVAGEEALRDWFQAAEAARRKLADWASRP